MLSSVRILREPGFEDTDLPLTPMNVIIGKNGVGKSRLTSLISNAASEAGQNHISWGTIQFMSLQWVLERYLPDNLREELAEFIKVMLDVNLNQSELCSPNSQRFIKLCAFMMASWAEEMLVFLDEPENGLHPSLLGVVSDFCHTAVEGGSQIVLTTYSPMLLSDFELSHVIVCEKRDNGLIHVQRAATSRLERWLQHFTLGQLWTMGQLEGRE